MRIGTYWARALSCVAFALAVTACLAATDDPGSVHVNSTGGRVKQDEKFDNGKDAAQKINAQTIRRFTRGGIQWLTITSKTLLPPDNMEFRTFESMLKSFKSKGDYPYDYVDIVYNSGIVGVVIGADGKPTEGPTAIQVFQLLPAPTDAGTFPFGAEGNLKYAKGQKGRDMLYYWSAEFKDTGTARMEISCKPLFIFRGGTLDVLSAKAFNAFGLAQPGVHVTCVVNTYNGTTSLGQLRTLDLGETAVIQGGSDPDPRVEMKNPNLDGMPAKATECEFIVSGPDSTYTPAKARIPIVDAVWIENMPLKGFDGTSQPPRLVVGVTKVSNAAKLKLSANVTPVGIGGTKQGIATILPQAASVAETVTPVEGVSAGSTQAKATKQGVTAPLAILDISVVKEIKYTVQFCQVVDTADPPHSGVLDPTTMDNILEQCKALWGDQANVTLDVQVMQNVVYNGNLTDTPGHDMITNVENSENCPKPNLAENKIVVLVFHNFIGQGESGFAEGGFAVVRKTDVTGPILAHEVGHYPSIHSIEDGNLMAGGREAASGSVPRPWQADYIRK